MKYAVRDDRNQDHAGACGPGRTRHLLCVIGWTDADQFALLQFFVQSRITIQMGLYPAGEMKSPGSCFDETEKKLPVGSLGC